MAYVVVRPGIKRTSFSVASAYFMNVFITLYFQSGLIIAVLIVSSP